MMKWLMVIVLPGVEDVFASCFLLVNILINEDLPTLERPMKAYSGLLAAGSLSIFVLL